MYYHVPVIAFVKRSGLSMSAIQVIFIIIIILFPQGHQGHQMIKKLSKTSLYESQNVPYNR